MAFACYRRFDDTEKINTLPDETEIVGLRAHPSPDGSDAKIIIHTSTGLQTLVISLGQITEAFAEIRGAAMLMLYRQALKADEGEAAVAEMLRGASRPQEVSAVIDRGSGDRLFVFQFTDRMPVTIRMSAEHVAETLDDLAAETRRVAN